MSKGEKMEIIDFKDVLFTKAERMLRPDTGHIAYTRVREGKLQRIPQKGVVLKERRKIERKGTIAKKVLQKDYNRFSKDLNQYFTFDSEVRKLKNQLEDLASKKEEVMSRLRPILGKFDNLSEEENKFKTDFMAEGFKHKFTSYPRETLPYKDLFEESFKRLNEKMQQEVSGLKETLKKITVQERFERLEKADSWSKIENHMKNILRIKEEMVRNMKKFDAKVTSRELVKARTKGAKDIKRRKPRAMTSHEKKFWSKFHEEKYGEKIDPRVWRGHFVKSELPKVIVIKEVLEKARVDPYVRERRGKFERVSGYESLRIRDQVIRKLAEKVVRQKAVDHTSLLQQSAWKKYGIMLSMGEANTYIKKVEPIVTKPKIMKELKKPKFPYRRSEGGNWNDTEIRKWAKDAAEDLKNDFGPEVVVDMFYDLAEGHLTFEPGLERFLRDKKGIENKFARKGYLAEEIGSAFDKLRKSKENGRTRSRKRLRRNHDISEKRKTAEPEGEGDDNV